jgi:aminoglycoside 6'-N-acetyltransferase I
VEIGPLGPGDHGEWLRLRGLLWPRDTKEELEEGGRILLGDPRRNAVFVARLAKGQLVGFVEASLRDWAEGCSTRPVGYVEGWFVTAEHRRQGVGRRLVEAAEQWARSRGCAEMGSDAHLSNTLSHKAHTALGYAEVDRVVAFAKKIGPGSGL